MARQTTDAPHTSEVVVGIPFHPFGPNQAGVFGPVFVSPWASIF
jgi:hypothetical protein